MRVAIFAFSRRGCAAAGRIRDALDGECRCYTIEKYCSRDFTAILPPLAKFAGPVFSWADALIFVGACGIAVRAIAPHLRDKRSDPAVVVVDEQEKFVISLLSGHIGGANALAEQLAARLDAVAVVTTATDVNGRFAVDAWAARQGLHIGSREAAKAVSAAILEGTVPLSADFPVSGELPRALSWGKQENWVSISPGKIGPPSGRHFCWPRRCCTWGSGAAGGPARKPSPQRWTRSWRNAGLRRKR